ncbi:MAG TPA: DUF5818 domain-containing protein [Vicinamibacterales bacterium]|nr:DUF5818 domain-containing protein [Vicinamibacterales bacterium]
MKPMRFIFAIILLASATVVGSETKTYVGIVTDSMCAQDHTAMKVSPNEKCVRECVRDGKTYKYALADGRRLYLLSDQDTPARFAGTKVRVTGVLYEKTNILKVDRIEPAK